MGTYDVLLFDTYFFDLVITGLPEVPRLGLDLFGSGMGIEAGGTFNTVRALHRLGLRPGWACDFGSDLFSQYVLDKVNAEGIDTSLLRLHDHPVRVFSLSFSMAHDRGFISYMDPRGPFDRVPYILEHRPAAVMLSALDYGPEAERLVEAAHHVGARVYMDCQSRSETLATPGVPEMIAKVDAFLPNAGEALQLTNAADVETAARELAELAPLVVVKMGADGALAISGDWRVHSPGLKVPVVDTTGAGDCFNAGFLYGQLHGLSLERSLRAGNFCGGMATTAFCTAAAPTLAELQAYLGALD